MALGDMINNVVDTVRGYFESGAQDIIGGETGPIQDMINGEAGGIQETISGIIDNNKQ